jgi:hypothetical protein
MVKPWGPSTADVLFDALGRAADAHHDYEERILKHPDENWAQWYSKFMATWLREHGYRIEET